MARKVDSGRIVPLRIFHLLMHVGHLLEERCRHDLSEVGLHHGQARVLMALKHHGSVNQADLARGMDIAPPTLSLMLKKLLKQRLVQRTAVREDERMYRIGLTLQGVRAAELVLKVWTEAEQTILASLEGADLQLLHDELLRVRNGLGGRSPRL